MSTWLERTSGSHERLRALFRKERHVVSANLEIKTEEIALPEEEIFRQRKEKLARLREEEGYDPFLIERWERSDLLNDVRQRFDHLEIDEADEDAILSVAGRVMTLRKHGKAMFANLQDETDTMQLYFQLNAMGEEAYDFAKKWVDNGDFVGVVGIPFRTRRGELTILVKESTLLSKVLRPLPEKWHGLKDTEVRYRQRYLDLMVNTDVRDTFRKRSDIIASMRKTLIDHGTLEVETPILSFWLEERMPVPSRPTIMPLMRTCTFALLRSYTSNVLWWGCLAESLKLAKTLGTKALTRCTILSLLSWKYIGPTLITPT